MSQSNRGSSPRLDLRSRHGTGRSEPPNLPNHTVSDNGRPTRGLALPITCRVLEEGAYERPGPVKVVSYILLLFAGSDIT